MNAVMDCQRRSLDERFTTAAVSAGKGSVIGMNLKVPCKITFSGKRLVTSIESADIRSGLDIVARSNVVVVVHKVKNVHFDFDFELKLA